MIKWVKIFKTIKSIRNTRQVVKFKVKKMAKCLLKHHCYCPMLLMRTIKTAVCLQTKSICITFMGYHSLTCYIFISWRKDVNYLNLHNCNDISYCWYSEYTKQDYLAIHTHPSEPKTLCQISVLNCNQISMTTISGYIN